MTDQAFEKIYREHFRIVYRFLLQLSGDPHLAEEITSETFFKALQRIEDYRGESSIHTWLCQVAKNTYYSHLRKQKNMVLVEVPDSEMDPLSCEDLVFGREMAKQVNALLNTLPARHRELFLLRAVGELSFKEIASRFQQSENWACVTYYRIKKMLQQQLEE